ncbi:MAG TPA: HEAT repeat domain-containing protein [Povalibacter sp.]
MKPEAIRSTLLCFLSALALPAVAGDLKLPRDGWAGWEVPAVDEAPAWCCQDWHGSDATPRPCRLDSGHDGYGSRDGATTDSIRVYARFDGGKIQRVRALSATCPVQTRTDIQELGTVSADDSARWLAELARTKDVDASTQAAVSRDALAALAIHRGDVAQDALAGIASNDPRRKNRKEAVFWLAHLRGLPGAKVATAIMFGDEDADVREHAAFAVSQSKSPDAAGDLIRLANTDADTGVRARAWFWLAKTESPATEGAIGSALRKESSDEVRQQAIFALSQLPEERATRALIAVAEDRSRPSEDRKQAVFWLAQSQANGAQAYLEKVLTANQSTTTR